MLAYQFVFRIRIVERAAHMFRESVSPNPKQKKASQPMSDKRLGGGTGSPQRGLLGRCRFWEGSWLDIGVG